MVLLAIGASLSVVLVAVYVAQGGGSGPAGLGARAPRGRPPEVTFALGVTSGNKEVDDYVRGFIDLCRQGKYDEYRLCCSAYMTPISGERFAAIWKSTRKVEITEIVPVPPEVKAMHPAYIVRAVAQLDPAAKVRTRVVEIMVQREENRWAVAPAPHLEAQPETLPAADAAAAPASRPAAEPAAQG